MGMIHASQTFLVCALRVAVMENDKVISFLKAAFVSE